MSKLSVFSIGATDAVVWDRDIIVACNHLQALELFVSMYPKYLFDVSIHYRPEWQDVLVTDLNGKTHLTRAKELIDLAESIGKTPVCVGKQHGLALFLVDGEYAVIARTDEDAISYLQTVISEERWEQLQSRLHTSTPLFEGEADEYEEEEPLIVPYMVSCILTIERADRWVTDTVDRHIGAAARKGINKAHLLCVVGPDGVMRDPGEAFID